MLEWRPKAWYHWLTMRAPQWVHAHYVLID